MVSEGFGFRSRGLILVYKYAIRSGMRGAEKSHWLFAFPIKGKKLFVTSGNLWLTFILLMVASCRSHDSVTKNKTFLARFR